jgi:hypothetical protein
MTTLAWIGALAGVAAVLVLLVRRGHRGAAVLPLAGVESLAEPGRRSWLLWSSLTVAVVAALAIFVVQARAQSSQEPLLEPGSDAVVVLDLSSSTRSASRSIAHTLLSLTRDPQRHLGLVVFSDRAYEALPPSTPVDGLEGWLQRFANDAPKDYPWASFSNGTTISSGLVVAHRLVRRHRAETPHVVLVSDLVDTPVDLQRLQLVVAQYQREGIDLRVVAVHQRGRASAPNAAFVERAASATIDPGRRQGTTTGALVLVALVAALGLLAAVYELAMHPFTWRVQT